MKSPPTTAMVDPQIAKAYRELDVKLKIVHALAGLTPERRTRVLKAICILYGLDDRASSMKAVDSK